MTAPAVRTAGGVAALALVVALAACAGTGTTGGGAKGGGEAAKASLNQSRYKIGKPYQVNGVWYYPQVDYQYDQTGIASWYGPGFHGEATANGETYDMNELTAAHKTLPLPSIVRVTNLENGRTITLRVNDRGPFVGDRIIDVSRHAAQLLGFYQAGTAPVRVQIEAQESQQLAAALTGAPTTVVAAAAPASPAAPPSTAPAGTMLASAPDVPPAAAATLPPAEVMLAVAEPTSAMTGSGADDGLSPTANSAAEAPLDPAGGPAAPTIAADPPPPVAAPATNPVWGGGGVTPEPVPAATAPPKAPPAAAAHGSAPPRPAPAAAARTVGPAHFVQAGAFADPVNVAKARSKLDPLGPVETMPLSVDGHRVVRVRVGPLGSEAEAQRVLAAAVRAGFTGSRLVLE